MENGEEEDVNDDDDVQRTFIGLSYSMKVNSFIRSHAYWLVANLLYYSRHSIARTLA